MFKLYKIIKYFGNTRLLCTHAMKSCMFMPDANPDGPVYFNFCKTTQPSLKGKIFEMNQLISFENSYKPSPKNCEPQKSNIKSKTCENQLWWVMRLYTRSQNYVSEITIKLSNHNTNPSNLHTKNIVKYISKIRINCCELFNAKISWNIDENYVRSGRRRWPSVHANYENSWG